MHIMNAMTTRRFYRPLTLVMQLGNYFNGATVSMLCLVLVILSAQATASEADFPMIPFGEKVSADGSGITSAWYSCATDRYRHGVLGDAIEGGCLVAVNDEGELLSLELSKQFVFEDNLPRLADIDNDGNNDIVTVRADTSKGAALVVYSEQDGELKELAATPPIGTAHRWLAPAGIADFNNDGINDIAYVQTPHIGGQLRIWSLIDNQFTEIAGMPGFSNHAIGATRVSISKVDDFNDDGVADLAIPARNGRETILVTLHPEPAELERRPFKLDFFD